MSKARRPNAPGKVGRRFTCSLSVAISPTMAHRLALAASASGRSRSSWIRRTLARNLEGLPGSPEGEPSEENQTSLWPQGGRREPSG